MVKVVKKRKLSDPTSNIPVKPQQKAKQGIPKDSPPKKEQQQKKHKSKLFKRFVGQRLMLQLKSGIMIQGEIASAECEKNGFIHFVDAVITGRDNSVTVEWVEVDRQQIGHFHPVPKDVKSLSSKSKNNGLKVQSGENTNNKQTDLVEKSIEKEGPGLTAMPDWRDKEAYKEYTFNLLSELKSNMSLKEVAEKLDLMGVKTRTGKDKWSTGTIGNILKKERRNEK